MKRTLAAAVFVLLTVVIASENARADDVVTIPEEFKICTHDADCIQVKLDCSGCSMPQFYDSINVASENNFDDLMKATCPKPQNDTDAFLIQHLCQGNMQVCGNSRCVDGHCKFIQSECPDFGSVPQEQLR